MSNIINTKSIYECIYCNMSFRLLASYNNHLDECALKPFKKNKFNKKQSELNV
jgi:hypothetical protein